MLKWAGGKRKLLPSMIERIPDNFNRYVEPFVGGGAMFFELRSRSLITGAVLSDVNSDLISLYTIIRDEPEQLIESIGDLDYRNNREDFNRRGTRRIFDCHKAGTERKICSDDRERQGRWRMPQLRLYDVKEDVSEIG